MATATGLGILHWTRRKSTRGETRYEMKMASTKGTMTWRVKCRAPAIATAANTIIDTVVSRE